MATFLSFTNDVLTEIGELQQLDLTTSVAYKGKLAVLAALSYVSRLHKWNFLIARLSPLSWAVNYAKLTPYQTLENVFVAPPDKLPHYLKEVNYYYITKQLLQNPSINSIYPTYYAVADEEQVIVYPAPTPAVQATTYFEVVTNYVLPTTEASVLDTTAPQSFYDCVSLYAQARLFRTHAADYEAAKLTVNEFQSMYKSARDRDYRASVSNIL